MCGIVGICFANNRDQLLAIKNMSQPLHHRGPDDHGEWFDFDANIALAHRRLSIIDLSAAGHQPMISQSGRYVISLNGEIYNHQLLRKKLQSNTFRGHSDTEVLLAAIEAWGIDKTLAECIGMFAIALWDREEKTVYLIRDRFGEKPLYYGWQNGTLIFSSELKAFQYFPQFQNKISKDALDLYLRYGYICAPYSIYDAIFKVIPGTYLKIKNSNSIDTVTYWSAKQTAINGIENPSSLSYEDAKNQLEKKLLETIALQMTADVPVGAFLSGGIDSSLVTALMQSQSRSPIETFSIGFGENAYNEAVQAKKVAQHFGTSHTELYVTDRMCCDLIPSFSILYDEPFADDSQLPSYLLAKIARKKVTVSLSGDAGDELFGGYSHYNYANSLWQKSRYFPEVIKKASGYVGKSLKKVPFPKRYVNLQRKLIKYANVFSAAVNPIDFYFSFTRSNANLWLSQSTREPLSKMNDPTNWLGDRHFIESMMYLDTVTYLPDDILTKVDRTTMAVSLESRIPFLDHRIYEFAWQLPLSYKFHQGQGKRILRDILYQYVPRALVDRPKQGFGIPLSQWIRGPLSQWFEDLFHQKNKLEEHWNVPFLRNNWQIAKQTNNTQYDTTFWAIFVFQKWLETAQTME